VTCDFGGIGDAIVVAVGVGERDGVQPACGDACAYPKIRWRGTLSEAIQSPASDCATGSECNGVLTPHRDA
jgi:hypothetical protein